MYSIKTGKPCSRLACIYIGVEKILVHLDDYLNAYRNYINLYIDVTILKMHILYTLFSSDCLPAFLSEGKKVHLDHHAVFVSPAFEQLTDCHGILYEHPSQTI
jgi:hypothetical protein